MNNLPLNLRRLRQKKMDTVHYVASYLSVKPKTYEAWESGVNEPSIKHLIALAEFYKFTIDELIR